MGNLFFNDFCVGDIGDLGDVGSLGEVGLHNSYSRPFLIGKNGFRTSDLGFRGGEIF
jgi:hypothetical protein